MQLIGEPVVEDGVVERRFDVAGHHGAVPGIVWTPEGATGPRPLVLVAHVAGGHKRNTHTLRLVERLVRPAGFAVAAIDMVGHGDRDGPPMPRDSNGALSVTPEFLRALDDMTEETIGDWHATVTALRGLDEIGGGPLGYWGVSMGTVFGLPLLTTMPRMSGAVLGLMGTFGASPPWVDIAPAVDCPVLYLAQRKDTLIQRRHAKDLYRQLGSTDKRLRVHAGSHSDMSARAFDRSASFLRKHLT